MSQPGQFTVNQQTGGIVMLKLSMDVTIKKTNVGLIKQDIYTYSHTIKVYLVINTIHLD